MAFYNDYRPIKFNDVLGQDTIVSILKQQAKLGRFAHSYLLCGPSGIGKTSTARILAMAANCENGVKKKGEPCGECNPCRAIKSGSHWDVLEIDGAKCRGIEEAKSLAYKAYLAPLNGRMKVYIIDEVHALTGEAFNVMLKLLEEPPLNVIVIMCTTEPEKIPQTVKSRCQIYAFKGLRPVNIRRKLEMICKKERIKLSPSRERFIAGTACGNMRVAENELEKVTILGRRR